MNIEVSGASNDVGANVQIYSKNNAICQRIEVTYVGDGYYKLKFMHSGKYLTVKSAGKENGTNIIQADDENSDAQKWVIKKLSDEKYCLISKCNIFCS